MPWRGNNFPQPAPPPRPRLQLEPLEPSLEGRRHFLCPLPLISRHSWQAQRRGSENREGAARQPSRGAGTQAWTRGKGAHGAQRRRRGSGARWLPGLLEAPPGHRGARGAGQVTVQSPATEAPPRRATRRDSLASRKVAGRPGQAGLATTGVAEAPAALSHLPQGSSHLNLPSRETGFPPGSVEPSVRQGVGLGRDPAGVGMPPGGQGAPTQPCGSPKPEGGPIWTRPSEAIRGPWCLRAWPSAQARARLART